MTAATQASVEVLLRGLKLPGFAAHHEDLAVRAQREGWSFGRFLHGLAELEHQERRTRRVERLVKQSGLPKEKVLAAVDRTKLPATVQRQLPVLCEGAFVERGENICCSAARSRQDSPRVRARPRAGAQVPRVRFVAAHTLVQEWLRAKRDLVLERELTPTISGNRVAAATTS